MVYSLNGYSPLYDIDTGFKKRLARGLIPKLAAPLRAPLLSEFEITSWDIGKKSTYYKPYISDIVEASRLFKQTALYPPADAFETLPFHSKLYKRIGKKYLDKRSGMSYGFFARQLPPKKESLVSLDSFKRKLGHDFPLGKDTFFYKNKLYILVNINGEKSYIAVPDVWVITTRSGCEKTDIDPNSDLVKIGLVNGKMVMQTPPGVNLTEGYRPSFDTKLILSQAAANAIYASILSHYKPNISFSKILFKQGAALAHWHGYLQLEHMPSGWYTYGLSNPAVSCSTPQASIYAFKGKEELFGESLSSGKEYFGDIHIEPHHGINVTYDSLIELAKFILKNNELFELGALEPQNS